MIYVQSNVERTLPHHFDCACALYGAIDNAMEYRLTSFEEVVSGKFDTLINKNLFVGSVEFMREVFKRIGLNDVRVPLNSNRKSEIITVEELKKRVSKGEKLFVKPLEIKLFSGLLIDNTCLSFLRDLPDETKVIVYEPFGSSINSEWRLYIHNNKIIDSRNYSGDFLISPNYDYALSVVEKNASTFPCAYTVDIGILRNKDNVVVEFNDMWAIGNYGIPNDQYLRMLRERYFQIIQNAQ